MKKENYRWLGLNCLSAFAVYWLVNLILWFPWSLSPALGITLMLTVSPIIWAIAVYQGLQRYSGTNLYKGATIVSFIYILIAIIADFIFFGLIRHAFKDLYQPSTFYGYMFLVCLPFIVAWAFSNKLKRRLVIQKRDYIRSAVLCLFSLLALYIIIRFKITI